LVALSREFRGFFPRELQVEIDGVRAQLVWCAGQPIAVINAWDIATGQGWIEKAEEWARKHRAFAHGFGLVVVRQFNVRD